MIVWMTEHAGWTVAAAIVATMIVAYAGTRP